MMILSAGKKMGVPDCLSQDNGYKEERIRDTHLLARKSWTPTFLSWIISGLFCKSIGIRLCLIMITALYNNNSIIRHLVHETMFMVDPA